MWVVEISGTHFWSIRQHQGPMSLNGTIVNGFLTVCALQAQEKR